MSAKALQGLNLLLTVVAAILTLLLMWKVTDIAYSVADLAVVFYALLAISPYWLCCRWSFTSNTATDDAMLMTITTTMIAVVGLYFYYHMFVELPNDHSGFSYLFVPCLQWLVLLAVERIRGS